MRVPSFAADGSLHDLASLTPRDVNWRAVAVSLAETARFNGQGNPRPVSVAQHCVMGADALYRDHGDDTLAALFLLHDAHEWRIGDITRPALALIKLHLAEISGDAALPDLLDQAVAAAKAGVDAVIYKAAGLPSPDRWPPRAKSAVKSMDERMLAAEVRAIFPKAARDIPHTVKSKMPNLAEPIRPWMQARSEEQWLDRLKRYAGVQWRI